MVVTHGVRCAGFGPLDPGPPGGDGRPKGVHSRWSDFVLLRLDEHLRVCREASALDRGAAAAVEGVFARAEAFLADTPGALLHGDLGNGNVLVAGARLTALIDWEDCLSGDPVFDLAGWGSFVGNHERRRRLLAGYTAEAALPDDFELRYALYTLRILLARTVHLHRVGYSRTVRFPAASRLRPAVEAVAARLWSPG